MCGIFAFITSSKKHHFSSPLLAEYLNSPFLAKRPQLLQDLLHQHPLLHFIKPSRLELAQVDPTLTARGPDHQNALHLDHPYQCYIYHSLLHMRGNQGSPTKQPLVLAESILQYNGEIYNIPPDQSDTLFLMELLRCSNNLPSALRQLNGDYAFIYHDLKKQEITICKDPFGKKSLLFGLTEDGFFFTSQMIGQQPVEIQDAEEEEDDGKTVDEKYLLRKYLNEFNQSMGKHCLELPNNCVITLHLGGEQIAWKLSPIIPDIIQLLQFKENLPYDQLVFKAYDLLIKSTREIIQNMFDFQGHFLVKGQVTEQGCVSVLFSGGIDCSLIVHILCKLLPPNSKINLINVSFTNDAPDRLTALAALQELQGLHPLMKLNLVLVDKTIEDIYKAEQEFLNIIYPKITHMDFNIAMVLNIASIGDSRVLLSGLGADEIFAGYARYKHAIKRGEVLEEMNFDLLRLWIRNLGRDDRSVSSKAKELRFPYLNMELIQFVRQCTNPEWYQQGETKSILRSICVREGLVGIAKHAKKAIQFGTKLAKLSNKRFFGGNKRAKGTLNYQVQNQQDLNGI